VEERQPPGPGVPEAPLRGSLNDAPLPQVLHRIFLEQLKGTLTLAREGEVRRLFFEKGELKTATSSRETQKIGTFLKRRGRISDEDLASALAEISRQHGTRFGKTLVSRGLLPKSAIESEMKRLVEEIVLSAFEWDSGEYRFEPSNAILDPDVALALSTAAVIVEGIRRLPDAPIYRQRLNGGPGVLRLARDPMSRYQYLALTPQEAYILSRVDGVLDVDALLAIAGKSRDAAAKTIYALLSCGLVEWSTGGPGPRRRESTGGVSRPSGEVAAEPPQRTTGHVEMVRNTWRRLDWLSHYDLLAVSKEAGVDEVRRAYVEKSRLFHPDLRHRADLAGMERELTAVFGRLKVAHDTLVDPAARAEYDMGLEDAPSVSAEETVRDPQAGRILAARNFARAAELVDAKDYYPAIEMLREAVRFAPDRADYRFKLGEIELKNSKWFDRGLENLQEAIRMAPTRGDFLRETARALAVNGRRQAAEMYARRAIEVEPGVESSLVLAEITGSPPEQLRLTKDGEPIKEPPAKEGLFARFRRKKKS
jgi:curved DNA-binding protein CbpA